MSTGHVGRYALGMCASAAMLTGCGTSQTTVGIPSGMPPSAAWPSRAPLERPWMAPEAQSDDLLYVSDNNGHVDVFSYPAGTRVGTLSGFKAPAGLCSDKRGHVFVTDTPAQDIVEYAHGGKKPIATLSDFGYYPDGCSVDPTTGNLAVTNYSSKLNNGPGNVAIYAHAKGSPTSYADPAFNEYFFCSYDDRGNLFIDGVNSGTTQTEFAALPMGGSSFTDIALDQKIGYPGAVQWDGRYVALEDVSSDVLYRVKVEGSGGTVVRTSHFRHQHADLLVQFWIAGPTIITPSGRIYRSSRSVGFWPYPRGGSATKVLQVAGATELFGVTVSLAKSSP
jgi:hypothetical protein